MSDANTPLIGPGGALYQESRWNSNDGWYLVTKMRDGSWKRL